MDKNENQVNPESPESNDDLSQAFNLGDWKKGVRYNDDDLLLALSYVCKHYDRQVSTSSLIAGLPVQNNILTPDLFVRAAVRAGLSSKIIRKNLDQIHSMTLPCILLLKGNKACIATEFNQKEEIFTIVIPESGEGEIKIGLAELKEIYDGNAIFIKPMYKYDKRSSNTPMPQSKYWLSSTLMKFWPIYFQVAIAAVLINFFTISTALFAMNVYDRVVPNNAFDTLIVLTIGIGIVYLFDFILKNLRVYFIDIAGKNADIILSSRIFEHILNIRNSHIPTSAGTFANEIREYETIREFFSSSTLTVLIDLPFLVISLFIIHYISPSLAIVPLMFIPFIIAVSYVIQIPLKSWVEKGFKESNQRHSMLIETINGLDTIKTCNAEGQIQQQWESFVSHASESNRKTKYISTLASNVAYIIQQVSYVAIIVVGVSLITDKQLTMGAMIGCTMLNGRLLAPVTQMVGTLTKIKHIFTSIEALDKILALPVERSESGVQSFIQKDSFEGDIAFQNVVFKYPEQENSCIKGVDLKINKGEKVVLTGKMGSGKSTIQKLILGLYQAEDGLVLVDNVDVKQIDPHDLRAQIGYVSQSIYLFHGSVRSNILFGTHGLDEEVFLNAASMAGVTDFVNLHPHGFDMPILEGGVNLSGGQKQSIAIARAIIKNPAIYLFDEPFSNMDIPTASSIINRLFPAIGDKTVIMITHKPNYMQLFPRMVIIQNGSVGFDGPSKEGLNKFLGNQTGGGNV